MSVVIGNDQDFIIIDHIDYSVTRSAVASFQGLLLFSYWASSECILYRVGLTTGVPTPRHF